MLFEALRCYWMQRQILTTRNNFHPKLSQARAWAQFQFDVRIKYNPAARGCARDLQLNLQSTDTIRVLEKAHTGLKYI